MHHPHDCIIVYLTECLGTFLLNFFLKEKEGEKPTPTLPLGHLELCHHASVIAVKVTVCCHCHYLSLSLYLSHSLSPSLLSLHSAMHFSALLCKTDQSGIFSWILKVTSR